MGVWITGPAVGMFVKRGSSYMVDRYHLYGVFHSSPTGRQGDEGCLWQGMGRMGKGRTL